MPLSERILMVLTFVLCAITIGIIISFSFVAWSAGLPVFLVWMLFVAFIIVCMVDAMRD